MSSLVFGRNNQVRFKSKEELEEAIQYIIGHPENVDIVREENQKQGAWGPEDRIQFHSEQGVPECLKRQMTAGNGSLYGRINCKEFVDLIEKRRKNR